MDIAWFLNLIENGDICSSVFLLLVLAWIGAIVARSRPESAPWGRRCALGVLLAYVAFRICTFSPTAPDELLWILLRGMLAAAFAASLTWILLPVGMTMWSLTGRRLISISRAASKTGRQRLHDQQVAEQRRQEQSARTREWERSAPERERQQRESEAHARVEREAVEAARRRREEARLRSELSYERHARQLAASFPRERFEQFMDRYLNNETAPELVEQREQLLKEMIVDSLGKSPTPKFDSITELAKFFADWRKEIDELPQDEDAKDAYRIQLNKQEDDAMKKLLRP